MRKQRRAWCVPWVRGCFAGWVHSTHADATVVLSQPHHPCSRTTFAISTRSGGHSPPAAVRHPTTAPEPGRGPHAAAAGGRALLQAAPQRGAARGAGAGRRPDPLERRAGGRAGVGAGGGATGPGAPCCLQRWCMREAAALQTPTPIPDPPSTT